MDPKPTIGRIVHYHLIDTMEAVPAIIVKVDEEDSDVVDLHVMHSKYQVRETGEIIVGGCFTRYNVRRKKGHYGCWFWPDRV